MTTAAAKVPQGRLAAPAHTRFNDNTRRARYGAAYVRSLCAHAGAGFNETSIDEDVQAVDATVDFARLPVRVQIKCTSQFKVGNGKLTLELEPGWVDKWTESDTTVFVVVVKVPAHVPSWVEHDDAVTRHNTVAFGRRFEPGVHTKSMTFTATDKLTSDTIYKWRDLAYDIYDGVVK